MFLADVCSQLGIAKDDEPPVLDVEAGGRLDGGFKSFLFLGSRYLLIGVEVLDGPAIEDGVFDLHIGLLDNELEV